MTTPDLVNAIFEAAGSLVVWGNVIRTNRDQGYAGVHPGYVALFLAWGFWNLYFYPHLDQWWSFLAGLSVVAANLTWMAAMWRWGRK